MTVKCHGSYMRLLPEAARNKDTHFDGVAYYVCGSCGAERAETKRDRKVRIKEVKQK